MNNRAILHAIEQSTANDISDFFGTERFQLRQEDQGKSNIESLMKGIAKGIAEGKRKKLNPPKITTAVYNHKAASAGYKGSRNQYNESNKKNEHQERESIEKSAEQTYESAYESTETEFEDLFTHNESSEFEFENFEY